VGFFVFSALVVGVFLLSGFSFFLVSFFGGVRVSVLVLELGRMAGAVTQDDIEELRRLLQEAKRPRVQFILSSQISTLEKVSTLIMMASSS
jgi:hypothetical protein